MDNVLFEYGSVAQLDRAVSFYLTGQWFESTRSYSRKYHLTRRLSDVRMTPSAGVKYDLSTLKFHVARPIYGSG